MWVRVLPVPTYGIIVAVAVTSHWLQGFTASSVAHALRVMAGRQEIMLLNENRQLRRLK
jgi:hypothetical protein